MSRHSLEDCVRLLNDVPKLLISPCQYKRYRAQKSCVRNASMLSWDHPGELTLVKGYALAASFDNLVSSLLDDELALHPRGTMAVHGAIERVLAGLEIERDARASRPNCVGALVLDARAVERDVVREP
jgi:hypothetical protein